MANARSRALKRSARTPPVLTRAPDAKNAAKNLVIMIVWISFAVAVPRVKQAPIKKGGITAALRPYNSLRGAHRSGPIPTLWHRQYRVPTSSRWSRFTPGGTKSSQALPLFPQHEILQQLVWWQKQNCNQHDDQQPR